MVSAPVHFSGQEIYTELFQQSQNVPSVCKNRSFLLLSNNYHGQLKPSALYFDYEILLLFNKNNSLEVGNV